MIWSLISSSKVLLIESDYLIGADQRKTYSIACGMVAYFALTKGREQISFTDTVKQLSA